VVQIQSLFQFRPDWYREGIIAERVGEYYVVLRTILRTRPSCVHAYGAAGLAGFSF
jgi:hypothetical protein